MIVDVDRYRVFQLGEEFLAPYREHSVHWGFGTLSWVTYKRTYSRDGEEWWQTCRRVMEGIMTVYRVHCLEQGLPWDATEAHRITEAAYERVWEFKWTPPGRGLWIMGTRFMYERGGAALNNCGFISTKNIASNYADPFVWVLNSKPVFAGRRVRIHLTLFQWIRLAPAAWESRHEMRHFRLFTSSIQGMRRVRTEVLRLARRAMRFVRGVRLL